MARINIEDSLFRDRRYLDLCVKFGSPTMALGAFCEACILAQEHYLSVENDRLIPLNEWQRNPVLNAVLEVGLAESRPRGIYVSGAEKSFAWLIQRSEAGKKLKAPRKKRPKSTDDRKLTKPNGSKPLPLTPPLTLSHSQTPPQDTKAAVAAYCERFKVRWGVNPQIQGKDAGIMGRVAKGMSSDRLAYLLDAYFSMPDAGVVKAKHPINFFELKMNEVVVFADSGNFTTTTQARQADQMASNHMLMEKLKREGK